jgi:hypothetical protein
MEPVSLTLGAIAAALVAKAADKTAERAVEGSAGVLKRFVGWLRERFSADAEQEGAAALARVEDAPDSPSRLRELAEVLDRRAHADAGFGSELKSLVDETQASGVDVGSIVQTAWGNQNVQTAGVVGSEITVNYGQPSPPPAR